MTASLNPRHHPPCATLRAHVAGQLNETAELFIAAHLALCPHCRQKLQGYEAKAGINLEDMPPENMDQACLENLLQRIDEHGPPLCIDVTIPPLNAAASFIPDVLQSYLGFQLDEFLWRQDEEGVFIYRQRHLAVALPRGLRLMRYRQGSKIKPGRDTQMLVLDGEVRTLFHLYSAGDVLPGEFFASLGARAEKETLGLVFGV